MNDIERIIATESVTLMDGREAIPVDTLRAALTQAETEWYHGHAGSAYRILDRDVRAALASSRPEPLDGPEPFWNRRWALFEDEDHSFCVVTDDDKAEYVVWPEMTERDYRRVTDAHNTVLNAALASSRPEPLDVERLRKAARALVALGNQPGLDDDEWEQAFTALEAAL